MSQPPVQPAYRYRATLERVVDADTFLLNVDLGFHTSVRVPIRLRGWNAPERHTSEGKRAIKFVQNLLDKHQDLIVETYRDRQTFARWVAGIWVDGEPLGRQLEEAGHAQPDRGRVEV